MSIGVGGVDEGDDGLVAVAGTASSFFLHEEKVKTIMRKGSIFFIKMNFMILTFPLKI